MSRRNRRDRAQPKKPAFTANYVGFVPKFETRVGCVKCGNLSRVQTRFPRSGGNRSVISTGPTFPQPSIDWPNGTSLFSFLSRVMRGAYTALHLEVHGVPH